MLFFININLEAAIDYYQVEKTKKSWSELVGLEENVANIEKQNILSQVFKNSNLETQQYIQNLIPSLNQELSDDNEAYQEQKNLSKGFKNGNKAEQMAKDYASKNYAETYKQIYLNKKLAQ